MITIFYEKVGTSIECKIHYKEDGFIYEFESEGSFENAEDIALNYIAGYLAGKNINDKVNISVKMVEFDEYGKGGKVLDSYTIDNF